MPRAPFSEQKLQRRRDLAKCRYYVEPDSRHAFAPINGPMRAPAPLPDLEIIPEPEPDDRRPVNWLRRHS